MPVRIWVECADGHEQDRLLASGEGRRFAGRGHVFRDCTDRPMPAVTLRPPEIAVAYEEADRAARA